MIERGDLGRIHGYRGRFVHDHLAARDDPTAWRLDPKRAGSGVVGDIGSHALDLARHLVGDITGVHATSRSILPGGSEPIDDEADILLRFRSGATGHIWISWLATGTPMDVGFEVMGDRGALHFTWTRPGELEFYDAQAAPERRGFTAIPLGPAHPAAAPFLPVAGAGMGYVQAFVALLGPFLAGLPAPANDGRVPSFADGLVISRYLHATLASTHSGDWSSIA